MFLKSPLATDYTGVPIIPSTATPRAAVEFIQTINIVDFSVISPLVTWQPTSITVDAPSWANFARYKKIQFSIGSVGGSTTQITNLQTRRNNTNYTATKQYLLESITSNTPTLVYTVTNSSTAVPLHVQATFTTNYIRQTDIFMTQLGGYCETAMGYHSSTLPTNSIVRTTFSILNPSSSGVPGYVETDTIGIQLNTSTGTFRPPETGGNQIRDYRLECNIYGWLR
jgi:hypothetical protein